ncbi:beta-glucosidase [Mariniflexile fucanivorans]|uniref:beta-glucosidase n=1 Tax=Mariniflexile fucanivorans TaxID=264023 RepID=A0A4R1RJA2_9FLAO|nr:glycoside hydrolase family 3 N-terminal domain-containing protein [Mariniflexile fucanivorans]TCL66214.1 beta-glucosidase [Mariniflexile fucanivorans]
MQKLIFILIFCFIGFGFIILPEKKYKQKDLPIDVRVQDLLSRMTLEEKVAQIRMFHSGLGVGLNEKDSLVLSDDVKGRLNFGIAGIKSPGDSYSPERAAKLNNQLQAYVIKNNRLGIPAFFVTESYSGVDARGCTQFGRPISLSSSWNIDLVKRIYNAMGHEARLRGLHLTHSPEADIARDPRFGRMSETFGEDTHLVTEMIVSSVTGLQGDSKGLNSTHIGAVTKHFAGYAQVSGGKNFASVEISPRTFIDEILPPFKAAVQRANTLGIMASHGDINGVASHANHELLTKILRNDWGFKGYVVSDANDIGRLHYFMKVAETPEDAARLALMAGVDVDLYADDAYALLPKMVKTDPSLIKYIDEAVSRVLRTKFTLGLFENPYTDIQKAKEVTRNDAAKKLAYEADEESIILLKNENSILPLDRNKKITIALVGPVLNSDAKSSFETVAGANINFVDDKGFKLTNGDATTPLLTPESETLKGIKQIVDKAKSSDLVVLFVGDDKYTSKEAYFSGGLGDRDNIDPVGQQDELLLELKKLGKPVIVVLKHRRTLSINTIEQHADAILDCWELSEFGDLAVAKTLFGDVCPSGKLPVTVPRNIGQMPIHYSQKEINFKKGYLFSESTPLFPFGYGLSYTSFEYSNLQLSDTVASTKSTINVSVNVKNTGSRTGKEVVQLYIKDIAGSVVRPMKELKGFRKIELKAGESQKVTFAVTPDMLEFTGLDMQVKVEPGQFQVQIGGSSDNVLIGSFEIRK